MNIEVFDEEELHDYYDEYYDLYTIPTSEDSVWYHTKIVCRIITHTILNMYAKLLILLKI